MQHGSDGPDSTPPELVDQLEALTAWRAAGAARHDTASAADRDELGRQLEDGALPAVVAVRDRARRDALEQALGGRGLAVVDPGQAGAVAVVVVDADGAQAVRAARAGWPTALVAAEVADDDAAPALLAAGAVAVFSSRVPAPQVVEALLACWRGERRAVVLL